MRARGTAKESESGGIESKSGDEVAVEEICRGRWDSGDEGGSGVEWLDEEYVFVRRVNGGG